MDKYDYITATLDEEKIRVEKIIAYLESENKHDELLEYKERYNNITKYLTAKKEYLNIVNSIKSDKEKVDELNKTKDECELDNILLEDTLLSKFNEDTNYKYRNLLYENIKYEDNSIKDILYLLFEKESSYSDITFKRNKLKNLLDKNKYPKTYDTLVSQNILIEKQDSILDEMFIVENNIKIKEDKIKKLASSVMTVPILKLLYEFWITNSYDPSKVDRDKVFEDNRSFISIKNSVPSSEEIKEEEKNSDFKELQSIIPDLNLPGINEDILININGKDYVKND